MNFIYKYISKSFHLIQDCIWSSTRRSIWSNIIGFIFFAVQICRVLCWFPISYHYHSIISAPGFPWPNPSIHIPPRKTHHLAPRNFCSNEKTNSTTRFDKNCGDLAMKGKPRPSKLLGASRWSLTMQEWESPEFSRKNKHIWHAFWQSSTTRTENHGMPVLALQNKDSTRWRWNLSQGCQKNMKWCLSLTQTYLGLITKFKTTKIIFIQKSFDERLKNHGTLSKSFRSHWSSGLVVWPNLSGDCACRKPRIP